MFTCYIIDDQNLSLDHLAQCIEKTATLSLLGRNTNPLEAIKEIKLLGAIDLVFLDVEMEELSGLEVAEMLPRNIAIIFTTAHTRYAFDAFEINAIDFLFKPYSFSRFLKAIEKAENYFQINGKVSKEQTSIFINVGIKGNIIQVHISDIIHISSDNTAITIHTNNEKFITHVRLREIEQKLPKQHFERIHRAFIVNVDLIKAINGKNVFMNNDTVLPLGENYRKTLLEKIQTKILKSYKS